MARAASLVYAPAVSGILFESSRRCFRKITEEDLEHLFQLDSDPEVVKYVDSRRPKTSEEVAQVLNRILCRDKEWEKAQIGLGLGLWAAELKENGDFVGWFALKPLPGFPDIELGYRLLRAHWGSGPATEGGRRILARGFLELELPIIAAITDPANAGSQNVLRKLGFRFIGKREFQSPGGWPATAVDLFRLGRAEFKLAQ